MAICGLIFGIFSQLLGFIPVLPTILAVVGVILCAVPFSKAKIDNQPAGAALAGLLLNVVYLVSSSGGGGGFFSNFF